MKTTALTLTLTLLAAPAFGQSMYKCQDIEGGPIRFQQTPCTITGGGEAVPLKSIPTGSGGGMSPQARRYLDQRTQARAEQAAAAEAERQRREALAVERDKVRAADEQAAALREQNRVLAAPRVITIYRR